MSFETPPGWSGSPSGRDDDGARLPGGRTAQGGFAAVAFERDYAPWILTEVSAGDAGPAVQDAELTVAWRPIGPRQLITKSTSWLDIPRRWKHRCWSSRMAAMTDPVIVGGGTARCFDGDVGFGSTPDAYVLPVRSQIWKEPCVIAKAPKGVQAELTPVNVSGDGWYHTAIFTGNVQ